MNYHWNTGRISGFTVLEILVVAVILIVLIGIAVPVSNRVKNKAQQATCISKMRALHGAFTSAITDKGEWPQIPTDEEGGLPDWDQDEYFQFWVKTMAPYGLSREAWVCPADESAVASLLNGEEDEFSGSYIPAWFSPGSGTPFKWNQPWAVERAGFHGRGHHVLMPDGSVTESANPFAGR